MFARAIAGIGGGGINTLTTVMVSDLVPLRQRGTFQGYGNIAYAVGSVVGAPVGGKMMSPGENKPKILTRFLTRVLDRYRGMALLLLYQPAASSYHGVRLHLPFDQLQLGGRGRNGHLGTVKDD